MAVIITGVSRLQGALAAMAVRQEAATKTAMTRALALVERETKNNLSLGSHRRGEPTTSSPGEPPDLVSGDLRRSIQHDGPNPHAPAGWEGEVGPTIVYGRIQQLGGSTGRANLPPRPYLLLDELMPEIAEIFKAAWAAALRG